MKRVINEGDARELARSASVRRVGKTKNKTSGRLKEVDYLIEF